MDTPEGFDAWSPECQKRFETLKQEYDARLAAEAELGQAVDDAQAKDEALASARQPQDAAAAEIAEIEAWIHNMDTVEQAEDARIQAELQRAFDEWVRATNPNEGARAAGWKRVQARRQRLMREFRRRQRAERATRRKRRDELEDAMKKGRPAVEQAEAEHEAARTRVRETEERIEGMRPEELMMEDYFALIRHCGPQDPKPGDPAIPITPRFAPRAVRPSFRPANIPPFKGFQPLSRFDHEQRRPAFIPPPARFVGSYPDILYPPHDAPPPEHPARPRPIPAADGAVWHEGCVQFLWVEGTHPHLAGPAVSNPITRSIEAAAAVVNDIWRGCCVRFTFSLKVVSMAQLGELAGQPDGVYLEGETVTCASRTEIDDAALRETIRELRDNPDCVAFLVVDEVRDGAGFATLAGRTGVVTIDRMNLPLEDEADADRSGTTTAHELGHALAGIKHAEGEGAGRVEHGHGELMWGEGCVDYPNRRRQRYERVTRADCRKMRDATRATTEPCTEAKPV